jgi:5-hydroxyisourate hydrolase
MSTITSHVLDTARGKPAGGMTIVIEISRGPERWTELARAVTDHDGRIVQFTPDLTLIAPGIYRLRFLTTAYFQALGIRGFYPEIAVTFQIDDPAQHYHIPLLLSPFGYTTYRGS